MFRRKNESKQDPNDIKIIYILNLIKIYIYSRKFNIKPHIEVGLKPRATRKRIIYTRKISVECKSHANIQLSGVRTVFASTRRRSKGWFGRGFCSPKHRKIRVKKFSQKRSQMHY